jgi:hypothetical protein
MKKLFQTFSVLISVAILVTLAGARIAKADATVAAAAAAENAATANDVPVNDEPAHSDAITTESSNADRSPAGWLSEPESDDDNGADSAESGVL